VITFAATLVTIAILLGVCWQICSWDPRLAVVPEIELQLKRLRPPSRLSIYLRAVEPWWNSFWEIAWIVLLVGGIGIVALVVVVLGAVSMFSMSEHELMTFLIMMACITVIFGGFKQ